MILTGYIYVYVASVISVASTEQCDVLQVPGQGHHHDPGGYVADRQHLQVRGRGEDDGRGDGHTTRTDQGTSACPVVGPCIGLVW